jgi:hypothetical protein
MIPSTTPAREMTELFPADVKPIRPGIYEVADRGGHGFFWKAEWVPGEGWRGTDGKWLLCQDRVWRGLKEPT